MNERELRDCFGLFATGVMIASTNYKDELYGMTINSFASVSLKPPMLLFSIANESYNLRFFKKTKYFSLNTLSVGQLPLAREFARHQNQHKWAMEEFYLTKLKNPVFNNSLGFFECKKHKLIKAGDHHILIGEIVDFAKLNDDKPLTYINSQFCI